MKRTSEKQEKILAFLRDFLDEHDYPPSIRDIQAGCSISSTSVVDYNLKALESKGLIRRDREISRGIVLMGDERSRAEGSGTIRVPVLGTIAAGQPLPVPTDEGMGTAHDGETVSVTAEMIGGANRLDIYALRVKGTSMIDALIGDGDIVILEPTNQVADGEMAAVYLKDANEVTLKRIYVEGERVRLQPMNVTMQPFYTAASNIDIQGRVVTAIRSM